MKVTVLSVLDRLFGCCLQSWLNSGGNLMTIPIQEFLQHV